MRLYLLFIFPCFTSFLFSQENEIFEHLKTEHGRNHCYALSEDDLTLYKDGTFFYTSNGWGEGKGVYVIQDSIITCTFDTPESKLTNKNYSIIIEKNSKNPGILILDEESKEPLIGCNVTYILKDGDQLDVSTDFYGFVKFPFKEVFKTQITYPGFKGCELSDIKNESMYTVELFPGELNHPIPAGSVYKFYRYHDLNGEIKIAKKN